VVEEALRFRGRVERATHGFHTYPAALHPDAAKLLLTLGEGPVLDPFCGGGTVLVEALLAGRSALGLDISPVANLVARARTTLTTEEERTALRSGARHATEIALHPPPPTDVPPDVVDWYDPHTLAELAALRSAIGKDPLLRAVFSSILVKTSRRASDTANVKEDKARPPGTAATLFHKKARLYARMLEELANAVPAGVRARVHREDARKMREKAEFGTILTSPPYPGVYDYLPMQRLRFDWLGLDPGDAMAEELGARRAFRADRATAAKTWRADTARWIRGCARALTPGGRLIVVTGDGVVGGKNIDSRSPIVEAAKEAGLNRVAQVTVERWDEGVRAMRPEHGLVFERPSAPAV
jgi:SAM-dependent methyltransferase